MNTYLRLTFLLLFISFLSTAQQATIKLEEFPDVKKVWGITEYQQVYDVLLQASSANKALPSLSNPYYKPFYDRLVSHENLAPIDNKQLDFTARFELTKSFYETCPEIVNLLAVDERYSEVTMICEFMMEGLLRMIRLFNDKMATVSPDQQEVFMKSLRDSKGVHTSTQGVLDIISDETIKENKKYVLSITHWLDNNLMELWIWMSIEDQNAIRTEIKNLSEKHSDAAIRALLTKLLAKIEAYQPPAPLVTLASIVEAGELIDNTYKNPILNLAVPIPGDRWEVKVKDELKKYKAKGNDAAAEKLDLTEADKLKSKDLLLLRDKNNQMALLNVMVEDISVDTDVKTGEDYLNEAKKLLLEIGYTCQPARKIKISGKDVWTMDIQTGEVMQEMSAITMQGKYVLLFILTFKNETDGTALRALRDNSKF